MNGMGSRKKDDSPFTPSDFFPSLKQDSDLSKPVQSIQDQIEAMELFTAIYAIQEKINSGELKVGSN